MKKLDPSSPEFRDLVKNITSLKISLPKIPIREKEELDYRSSVLTGNKDTDLIILSNLNDYDLSSVCRVNKYTRELCNNESFWMNRTTKRFGQFSRDINVDRLKLNMTWKQFYVKLVDIVEYFYRNGKNVEQRFQKTFPNIPFLKIFENIGQLIERNTGQSSYVILVEKDLNKAKAFLNKDFVNPNKIFTTAKLYEQLELSYYKKVLEILKADPRFKPEILLHKTFSMNIDWIEIFLEEIYNLLTWQEILSQLVKSLYGKVSGKSYTTIYLKYAVLLGATSNDIKEAFSKAERNKITTKEKGIVSRFRNKM